MKSAKAFNSGLVDLAYGTTVHGVDYSLRHAPAELASRAADHSFIGQSTKRFVLLLTIAGLVTFAYWMLYGEDTAGVDDANIYFKYARNFAAGHGYVFFEGGERVQGFSSELWQLVCTSLYSMTPTHFEKLLLALNIVFVSATWWFACSMLDVLLGNRRRRLLPPAHALATCATIVAPGFIEWNVLALMETGMWSFGITASVYCLFMLAGGKDERRWHVAFICTLPLIGASRPEGVLWIAFLVVLKGGVVYLETRKLSSAVHSVRIAAAVGISAVMSLVAWRLWYFGAPLPNTYYAKVSSDRLEDLLFGLLYFGKSAVYNPIFFVGASCVVAGAVYTCRQLRAASAAEHQHVRLFGILEAALCLALLIPLYTGGDHFAFGRFYQPFLPLFLVVLVARPHIWLKSVLDAPELAPWVRYGLASVGLVAAATMPSFELLHFDRLGLVHGQRSPVQAEFDLARRGRQTARALNHFFAGSEMPSCGVVAAGGFPYEYAGASIDLLGLNSVAMARASREKRGKKGHASFHKPTFYELSPDLLVCENMQLTESPPAAMEIGGDIAIWLKRIADDPEFWQAYDSVVITRRGHEHAVSAIASFRYIEKARRQGFDVEPWERYVASHRAEHAMRPPTSINEN